MQDYICHDTLNTIFIIHCNISFNKMSLRSFEGLQIFFGYRKSEWIERDICPELAND